MAAVVWLAPHEIPDPPEDPEPGKKVTVT